MASTGTREDALLKIYFVTARMRLRALPGFVAGVKTQFQMNYNNGITVYDT